MHVFENTISLSETWCEEVPIEIYIFSAQTLVKDNEKKENIEAAHAGQKKKL